MIPRETFLAEARSWAGVRWHHQGRSRLGVDCIGLLLVTCWALELTDYDVTGYGRSPDPAWLRAECDRLMIPTNNPQPGDVYLMRFGTRPQHIAIVTERGLLHARAASRKVVETTLPDAWRHQVVAAYTVPGVR